MNRVGGSTMTRLHVRIALAAVAGLIIAAALTESPRVVQAAAGVAVQVPLAGTGSPQTDDAPPSNDGSVSDEFPVADENEADVDEYPGSIVDRSLSRGVGQGVSVNSGPKAKSKQQLNVSFEGLNFYQQRYARSGNQFSVEPPDQALCVGNGYVLEAVNDVLNVYNQGGESVLPDNTATNIV